jgi:hypothetical protein
MTPADPQPSPDDLEERLDHLQDGIDAARRQAQEHGTLPNPHHERTLADPDGDGDEDEDAPGAMGG